MKKKKKTISFVTWFDSTFAHNVVFFFSSWYEIDGMKVLMVKGEKTGHMRENDKVKRH